MTGKFIRHFEVGARAMTPNCRLAPSDMFDYLQETATVHSDVLGYDFEFFAKEKKGWTILNWQAEFYRLPKWREKLVVETWPTKGKGLVAHRSFHVLDEDGNVLMKVISQWVFFDLVRRRPIKVIDKMLDSYTSDIEEIIPAKKIVIAQPDDSVKVGGCHLTVRRSHTDSNFHVNNVAYLKWIEDDIPGDAFYNKKIKSVYVNYQKEARAGEEITSSVYEAEKDSFACFIKSADGNTFANALYNYEN